MVRSSIGSTWYLSSFLHEQGLHLLQLRGLLGSQVLGETEIVPHVVEVPDIGGQRRQVARLPWRAVDGAGQPAIVVDRAIAEHLEVLRLVPLGRLRIVEGVEHAGALDGRLHRAVDALGLRQAGGLQDRGGDVDDVRELSCAGRPSP